MPYNDIKKIFFSRGSRVLTVYPDKYPPEKPTVSRVWARYEIQCITPKTSFQKQQQQE